MAEPATKPSDPTTIRAVERRIATLREEIARLQRMLAADEEWLDDLNRH